MTSIDAIINRQLFRWELERRRTEDQPAPPLSPARIITVSRQSGSRGSYLATMLAERLGYQRLHREVIDAISKSSGYYKRLIQLLDEHARGHLEMSVQSVFTGQYLDHRDYVEHLYRLILSVATLGGVVLTGRGGNFILGPQRGFHLRVVCEDAERIRNLMRYKGLSVKVARDYVERTDRERREFIASVFHANINDPIHYDLVVNTSHMEIESLIDLAESAFKAKMAYLAARLASHDAETPA